MNAHDCLKQIDLIFLYMLKSGSGSLIILDIYNTTPLIYHLQIIKKEYYNIYFYYPALLSCCKQTLIHHQSPGSFYKLEGEKWKKKKKRGNVCVLQAPSPVLCES